MMIQLRKSSQAKPSPLSKRTYLDMVLKSNPSLPRNQRGMKRAWILKMQLRGTSSNAL